ncbi:flagellar assembly protein FliH [Microbulbifer harenosus]|uniref:Flagellar assembly protein FliH n=1 Tax=Microbulbifer harenosus TaxID=2576840 RepID=A0ABY2UN30_9GAMM|nr:flagellar assembly protein FliH [Microbulbifer harenosus]TLM79979.1 flagellar assembly protein FliH [Microbulbifer harenosus]
MSEARAWTRWQPDDLSGQHERRAALHRSLSDELNALREQARAEARQQGYDAGYAEGFERGRAEGYTEGHSAGLAETGQQRRELLTPLTALAQNFSEALAQLDSDIAADITALALVVGKHLAGEALRAEPQQVTRLVQKLLRAEPTTNGHTRLWLHPDDLPLVQQELGAELERAGWELEQDPRLARGGCRVTTGTGEIDASRENHWNALLARLLPQADGGSGEHAP